MKFNDATEEYDYFRPEIDRMSQKGIRKTWVDIIKRGNESRLLYMHGLCEKVIKELGLGIMLGSKDVRILHKHKKKAYMTMSVLWCALKEVPDAYKDYNKAVEWLFGSAKSKRKEFKENVWETVSDALLDEEFWSSAEINKLPKELLLNNDVKNEIVSLFENMPNAKDPEELMHRFWKLYKDTSCYSKHNAHEEIFWYI